MEKSAEDEAGGSPVRAVVGKSESRGSIPEKNASSEAATAVQGVPQEACVAEEEDWYFVANARETHDMAETAPGREDEELFSKNEEEDMSNDVPIASCPAGVAFVMERDSNNPSGSELPGSGMDRNTGISIAAQCTSGKACIEIGKREESAALKLDCAAVSEAATYANPLPTRLGIEEQTEFSKLANAADSGAAVGEVDKQSPPLSHEGKLQTHCYVCGSFPVCLKLAPKGKKSIPSLHRHRCMRLTCRKFTGDFYIRTKDGGFVVYKRDVRDYAYRHMANEVFLNMNAEAACEESVIDAIAVSDGSALTMDEERQGAAVSVTIGTDNGNPSSREGTQGGTGSSLIVLKDAISPHSINDCCAAVTSFGLDMEESDTPDSLESQPSGDQNCNILKATNGGKMDILITKPFTACKRNSGRRCQTVRKQPGGLSRLLDDSVKQNMFNMDNKKQLSAVQAETTNPVDEIVSVLHESAAIKASSVKKSRSRFSDAGKGKSVGKSKLGSHRSKTRRIGIKEQSYVRSDFSLSKVFEEQPKRKTRSWGTQTFTYKVIGTPTASQTSVCTQTELSKSDVVDLLLSEWSGGGVTEINIRDQQTLLRRIKIAQTILYLQNKELRVLRQERRSFKDVLEKAKYAVGELKKQYASQLARVREEITTLTNEFRLYHLDLQRACLSCSLKMKEEEKKFLLVASKYVEENESLKGNVAEMEKKVELCNDIIYSKTRDLLCADRDVHLANQQAANAQKKLEDKLFMASHTKCTSCAVFEKFRDVLTTQIADKTNALSEATRMVNELKVKLEKQERASQIMSKEINRIKFERDAWITDSRRLEYEVNSLRVRLGEESLEAGDFLAPTADAVISGQAATVKWKDQHVSPALSSPPSIHSGFGGEKVPGIRISEENSESQNVSEDAAPCAQRSKKNVGYSKSEKDSAVHDLPLLARSERRTERRDAALTRYSWLPSASQRKDLQSKTKSVDNPRSVAKGKESKDSDAEDSPGRKKKVIEAGSQKKERGRKVGAKAKNDAIETRSPLDFYRGASTSKTKSGFLGRMIAKGLVSDKDGEPSNVEQMDKIESMVKKEKNDAANLALSPSSLDIQAKEREVLARADQPHSKSTKSRSGKNEENEHLPAAKIKPPVQDMRSPSPSFIVTDEEWSEDRRREQGRKRSPAGKRHEIVDTSRVAPVAHHHSRHVAPTSPSRSPHLIEDLVSPKRTTPVPWHRKNRPLSPTFNGPRCSARPFVDRLSPVPFSKLHMSDSSGMLTGDKGIVHGGLPENLELHRLEHPLEITRPSVRNDSPLSGSSESWQGWRSGVEQSWRAVERQVPFETWGGKRICLERDRPAELSEIRARTESFVTNIPPWNGPALSPRECSRSPLPSYRDESGLWRSGQRRIFNGPESLCPSAEMDNNRPWNREQWNVRDRSDDELRPRGNVSGDVMAWRQAEHWTSRERYADRSMDRRW